MVDRAVRFVPTDEPETPHEPVDLARCSSQEYPPLTLSSLFTCVGEQALWGVNFRVNRNRHESDFSAQASVQPLRYRTHPRGQYQAWSGTRRIEEVEEHRASAKRGQGEGPTMLVGQLDIKKTVAIASRRSSRRASVTVTRVCRDS